MGRPGTFKPGQCGNPKGRPKTAKAIREAFLEAAERAKEIILELAEHAADERVRLAAAKEILDRAIGKAPVMDENGDVVKDERVTVVVPQYKGEKDAGE